MGRTGGITGEGLRPNLYIQEEVEAGVFGGGGLIELVCIVLVV